MGTKNIIELNGKRYDAVSGALLDSPSQASTEHRVAKLVSSKKVFDDVIKPTSGHKLKTKKHVEDNDHGSKISDFAPRHKRFARPHQPQHTTTLARKAVKKPDITPKKIKQVQTSSSSLMTGIRQFPVDTKMALDERRAILSQQIKKNALVSRFGKHPQAGFVKHVEPIPVKKPPVPHHSDSILSSRARVSEHNIKTRSLDIFANGLARAESHNQKPLSKSQVKKQNGKWFKPQTLYILSLVVIALFIISYLTYQNLPRIELHIAADRSGISAEFPGYSPSGFKVSTPIKYASGIITIDYHSISDSRSFSIVQQVSSWDNTSLEDNVLANNNQTFTTIQNKGRTIYLYNNNATWVSNGIWYQINSNANLSRDQLVNLISSL